MAQAGRLPRGKSPRLFPGRLTASRNVKTLVWTASLARTAWLATAALLPGCSSHVTDAFPTAQHVPYPHVPGGAGPTLASASVVTVSFAGDSHTSDLTAFVDWLGESDWPHQVAAEYGVRGLGPQIHVDLDSAAPSTVTDDDVQALLAASVGDGILPRAPASGSPLLYVVFYPDGTSVTRASGDACTANPGNGYHGMTGGTGPNVPYVVVPSCYPRFSALLSEVQGMELETARLIIDAATDPSPLDAPAFELTDGSNPWTSMGSEVGDLCWGRLAAEGPGYTLQRAWSDAAASAGDDPCIPVPAGSVPFGVTASPSILQTITVGVPLKFTVTGWSRGPVADWPIEASGWVGDYEIDASLDRETLNNGETATLTVTIPDAQPSGTFGAVLLRASGPADDPAWPVTFVVN